MVFFVCAKLRKATRVMRDDNAGSKMIHTKNVLELRLTLTCKITTGFQIYPTNVSEVIVRKRA